MPTHEPAAHLLANADRDFAVSNDAVNELIKEITTLFTTTSDPTRVWALVAESLDREAEQAGHDERVFGQVVSYLTAACIRLAQQQRGETTDPATTPLDYEVRTYIPAQGSDDASTTYVLDALGWSITLRKRHLDNEDGPPQTDTVVEITEGTGPLEVIVRGTSSYHQ